METLGTGAIRSSQACQGAEAAINEWDEMIGVLRRALLDRQEGVRPPPAPIAPLLERDPSILSIPFPTDWTLCVAFVPNLEHPYWEAALSCEACLRRFYKSLTSGDGNTPDWTLLESPSGVRYLSVLTLKFKANTFFLMSLTTPAYVRSVKSHILLNSVVSPRYCCYWKCPNSASIYKCSVQILKPIARLSLRAW